VNQQKPGHCAVIAFRRAPTRDSRSLKPRVGAFETASGARPSSTRALLACSDSAADYWSGCAPFDTQNSF
jgi:hypothetical protein